MFVKYVLSVLFFCFLVPGVVFAATKFPIGGVAVMHSNCTETDYAAASNSDTARGTALHSAASALVAGDVMYLTSGVFNMGDNGIQ